ncbi:unnamed protein product, partial [Oppiella nova]
HEVYGPVVTVWIGNFPFVFICDLDIAREGFGKWELTGRPPSQFGSILSNASHHGIIFNENLKSWESLRQVAQTAIRFNIENVELKKFKYCSTDFLPDLGNSMYLYEFIPLLRPFMKNPLDLYQSYFTEIKDYTRNIYKTHENTYDKDINRDFCDVLIAAKLKAICEDRESAHRSRNINDNTFMDDIIDDT